MERCTLLHVEDSESEAFVFRLALEENRPGVSLFRVPNGARALAFLRKADGYANARTPQVVVLDLNLPLLDGWSVLKQIKDDPVLQSLPVVILSTAPASANEARALKSGAHSYLQKAKDFTTFVQQVKGICDLIPASSTKKQTLERTTDKSLNAKSRC